MRQLLNFLFQRREIGLFLILEILSIWLLISYNRRYNASFLNSSNRVSASISQTSSKISDYFKLANINEELVRENEKLRQQVNELKKTPYAFSDTLSRYAVLSAKVISNTFNRSTNFITLAGGRNERLKPGMGVISKDGVVGQIKSVSQNFSTVFSLLHPNLMVSSKVKRTGTNATVQWDQRDHAHAMLRYIPRHINILKGDTITTSGFNSVFPEDILLGVVEDFSLSEEMTFYDARIKLATDFTSLTNVYVIKDLLKQEKDSVQQL